MYVRIPHNIYGEEQMADTEFSILAPEASLCENKNKPAIKYKMLPL